MKELGEALKTVFDKVGQFLDLFDLSFLISGVVAAGAAWTWMSVALPISSLTLPKWAQVVATIVGVYATGLVSFAIGRLFRTTLPPLVRKLVRRPKYSAFDAEFAATLKGHQLEHVEPFKSYLAVTEVRGIWALYARLWAEIRSDPQVTPSLNYLNRFWVMAATYDGLAFAILMWGLVAVAFTFGLGVPAILDKRLGIVAASASVLVAYTCLHEAGRYAEYQIYELVATIAAR